MHCYLFLLAFNYKALVRKIHYHVKTGKNGLYLGPTPRSSVNWRTRAGFKSNCDIWPCVSFSFPPFFFPSFLFFSCSPSPFLYLLNLFLYWHVRLPTDKYWSRYRIRNFFLSHAFGDRTQILILHADFTIFFPFTGM